MYARFGDRLLDGARKDAQRINTHRKTLRNAGNPPRSSIGSRARPAQSLPARLQFRELIPTEPHRLITRLESRNILGAISVICYTASRFRQEGSLLNKKIAEKPAQVWLEVWSPGGRRSSQVADELTVFQLLERCRQRPLDEAAWNEFVRRYDPAIRAHVARTYRVRASQETD